ncbi:DotU family type IV/VI secretion system protein [uncultured Paludibaculum sp.]|uniref:DotU family type IV/VI secretion system protein n=1 Tax=uncultured Paludibaculum sp. TaxID=1765020 RepID=UPI002AAACDBA|nr:DotU family type IV/VI secretion system protein [uncultured Paludibaculum sp.]
MSQPYTAETASRRPSNLALILQEALTATVRIRSMPQAVSSEEAFRQQMREALKLAAQEARSPGGYSPEDIKMAIFAVVGFLDESILKAGNRTFSEWPTKPLQEEFFGTHLAGELFYQNLERLLKMEDSAELADLLEVHQLCMLLGFRGRYIARSPMEFQAVLNTVADKIARIRGEYGALTEAWRLPNERIVQGADPWSKRLLYTAIGCLAFTLLLYAGFKWSLVSGVSEVAAVHVRSR